MISAVINTLNAETHIPLALGSVRSWVDEIVVVDMHSVDSTVDIAREFGAKVFFHERMGFADPARAFALEQAQGDWILILDADEVVPPTLSKTLLQIAQRGEADVVKIPRLNYLLGAPLMHSGWGPDQDTHFRFFRKGSLQTTATVHNYLHPVPNARIRTMKYEPGLALVHFNYLDSEDFIERLNRYTTIDAGQAFALEERSSPANAIARAAGEFAKRYMLCSGWRDGWRGLYLSLFMAFYRIAKAAKLQERTELGDRQKTSAGYRKIAESLLQEYGELDRGAPFETPQEKMTK
jgi:glycosyltransferase involved in cell wall biosynthesis